MPGKKLQIPYIEFPGAAGVLEKQGVMAEINEVNWPDFSYQPEVVLFCGYTSDEILLNYRVKESHVRALNNEINAEVYKDSCVEFFISPNQGEEPKPLAKIASGGEISRIVLAIKKILAENYRVPTLLFDEVDSGIGGAVAESVAIKLKEIAVTHQVLCITHLPQIAAYADFHYRVSKQVDNGRTVTCVTMLDDQGRLEELSRMLGGRNISAKTMEHAKEMLKSAGTD